MSTLIAIGFVVAVGALAYIFRAKIESWLAGEVTQVEDKLTGSGSTGPKGA